MESRVSRLEARELPRGPAVNNPNPCHTRSREYLKARRSIRIWPIDNHSDEGLWKGTGDFIHTALGIPEEDLAPEDIESITAVKPSGIRGSHVRDEAIVSFFCPRKRDTLLAGAPNLATFIDDQCRPTLGIRREIPLELDGTFRLLSRFGARLRARHGEGTKRHIKFDDIEGTLIMNIKLPGDERWSVVTPAMARSDHEAHSGEEAMKTLKRISGNRNLSGPSRRLASPIFPVVSAAARTADTGAPAARTLTTLDELEREMTSVRAQLHRRAASQARERLGQGENRGELGRPGREPPGYRKRERAFGKEETV